LSPTKHAIKRKDPTKKKGEVAAGKLQK